MHRRRLGCAEVVEIEMCTSLDTDGDSLTYDGVAGMYMTWESQVVILPWSGLVMVVVKGWDLLD